MTISPWSVESETAPERRLWVAAVSLALADAASGDDELEADARRWIRSRHFAEVAAALDLDARRLRARLAQGGR